MLCAGDVKEGGINRSPSAYLRNPEEERGRYSSNVDTEMTLLKFVDGASGKSVGAFNWFATHGTSMSRDNKLISGDNKGAASRLLEDLFSFNLRPSSSLTNSTSKPGLYSVYHFSFLFLLNRQLNYSSSFFFSFVHVW